MIKERDLVPLFNILLFLRLSKRYCNIFTVGELVMSAWNKECIAEKRKELAEETLKDLNRDQLIDRIVALETTLYPFAYVYGSLDSNPWRGSSATSKLFPMFSEKGNFLVYEDSNSKEIKRDDLLESQYHSTDYYTEDSLVILNGTNLHDDFTLLEVSQQAPGAHISCGSISMGDVRDAAKLLFPK